MTCLHYNIFILNFIDQWIDWLVWLVDLLIAPHGQQLLTNWFQEQFCCYTELLTETVVLKQDFIKGYEKILWGKKSN